ncbi:hypothetical protein J45TS6_46560 [Paenibacillus sp. J45TS6]|uniref:hypothetical protein n=1 Tax=Paenibacillus sp. J45TS6 TaxID=2807196 RepID=UPI001B2AE71F|nr:hypothetical protein [Paenibacillus sp. J45TS6]GIP46197.1 hypothetical protein J45TS6_46560 [Paenibacillus sp. J45TS6]
MLKKEMCFQLIIYSAEVSQKIGLQTNYPLGRGGPIGLEMIKRIASTRKPSFTRRDESKLCE